MICCENMVDVIPLFKNTLIYKGSLSYNPSHIYIYIYEKWYVYNIFTTFLQQVLSGRLLLVVIVGTEK